MRLAKVNESLSPQMLSPLFLTSENVLPKNFRVNELKHFVPFDIFLDPIAVEEIFSS